MKNAYFFVFLYGNCDILFAEVYVCFYLGKG